MSLILGICFGHIGILLADKRLNLTYSNGSEAINDSKPLNVEVSRDRLLSWGSDYRKMTPVSKGFSATAGEAILGRLILDGLKKTNSTTGIESTISDASNTAQEIYKIMPAETIPSLKKTAVMILKEQKGFLTLSSYTGDGEKLLENVGYTAYWPPELSSALSAELTEKLSTFQAPTSFDSIYKCIRGLSSIANTVSKNSKTVSSDIEIGLGVIVQDTLRLAVGRGAAHSIAHASDSDFNSILEQVSS